MDALVAFEQYVPFSSFVAVAMAAVTRAIEAMKGYVTRNHSVDGFA